MSNPQIPDRHAELAQQLLACGYDQLSPVQKSVIDLIATEAPSAVDPTLRKDDRTYWERLADRVAEIGGSWNFIFGFGAALGLWILWNVATRGFGLSFDPYPFIFLNLMLSMLAAVQAPVIMMSQNRQETKDRLRARNDYQVNLKAELEIRHLHEKMDHLLSHQWERMIEIQELQLDLLNELRRPR